MQILSTNVFLTHWKKYLLSLREIKRHKQAEAGIHFLASDSWQIQHLEQSQSVRSRLPLTCPMQLRLPSVLQAWLKSSSSQGGKDEPVPPMQSKLSRLRLLESSRRDGRQLERRDEEMRGKQDKGDALRIWNISMKIKGNVRSAWAHYQRKDGKLLMLIIYHGRKAEGKHGSREKMNDQQNQQLKER